MSCPHVRFINNSSTHLPQWQIVITELINCAAQKLELPSQLEVVFADLGPSVYGDTRVDNRFKNRITVNTSLQLRDVPHVLIHELIHVNQIHTGLLWCDPGGNMHWRGVNWGSPDNLTWEEYCALPWEADVTAKHRQLLLTVLDNK